MTDWNELISDVVAGHWKDPATGKTATVPFEVIRIEDDLDGGEADMLAPLKLGKRIAFMEADMTDEAGTLLARLTTSAVPIAIPQGGGNMVERT